MLAEKNRTNCVRWQEVKLKTNINQLLTTK